MTLSRRSLLTGLLSTAAAIAARPVAKMIPARELTPSNVLSWGSDSKNASVWQISWDNETAYQTFRRHYASQRLVTEDWSYRFTRLSPS